MVIPGVQPHFMMLRGLADDRFIFRADAPAGPCGSGQQDIPAVERCRARAQHFVQKGRFNQAPQVTPHIVWPDAEEKRRAHVVFAQQLQQPRHTLARAAKGVDVNA